MADIALIGFVQAIFVLSLLAIRKGKKLADYVLLIFILNIGFKFFGIAVEYKNWEVFMEFAFIGDLFYWCLLGPLLYVYIQTVISGRKRVRLTYLVHLLPLIFVWVTFAGYIFGSREEGSLVLFIDSSNSIFPTIGFWVFVLVSPFYFVLSIVKLIRHRIRIR